MRSTHCLMLLLTLLPFPLVAGTPLPDAPHIVVTGEGKTGARPDSASITVDFSQRATQPLPAKQAVDQQVNALLEATARFDVAADGVRASDLRTEEDVDYDDKGRRISNGYVAERSVVVVLKDVERLNAFLDAALAAGADDVSDVVLASTQADSLRASAKQQAVENARQKATEMAGAFGVALGGVYSIDSINSRYANAWSGATLDRVQVTGSRSGGGRYLQPRVEYSESVSVVFELKR